MKPGYTTEVVTDEQDFAALAPAWARLYRRCATATPFQSHAWLHSWWLSYGGRGRSCAWWWCAPATTSSPSPR